MVSTTITISSDGDSDADDVDVPSMGTQQTQSQRDKRRRGTAANPYLIVDEGEDSPANNKSQNQHHLHHIPSAVNHEQNISGHSTVAPSERHSSTASEAGVVKLILERLGRPLPLSQKQTERIRKLWRTGQLDELLDAGDDARKRATYLREDAIFSPVLKCEKMVGFLKTRTAGFSSADKC